MNRTDRLIAIVLLLHSRKVVRAKEIARHFDIAIRTVYRDMKALNEAGVPIAAESGEGYSLVEGYHLPPVMFTREEASALYLGGKLAEHFTDQSLREPIASAMTKIHAILPLEKKDYLERLESSTAIFGKRIRFKDGFVDDALSSIQDAIVHRKLLSIDYYSNHSDSVTQRKVEPLGLIYYSDYWHLIAYCRMRKDYRDFRTDRIKAMTLMDESFNGHDDFSVKAYFEEHNRMDTFTEVTVIFKKSVANYLRDRSYYGLVEQKNTGDGVIMTFMIPEIKYIIGWLLSFGDSVRVLAPIELNQLLLKEAERLVEQYRQG
ncbi:YafY family transcriptional regulator [bacterium]|nr:YafY family transcriptional regulator [bacterium]